MTSPVPPGPLPQPIVESPTDLAKSPHEEPQSRTVRFLINNRIWLLIVAHTFLFCIVLWFAFLMRFTLRVPENYVKLYFNSLLPFVAVKLIVFYSMGSFHGWWRHVNFSDLISLAKSSAVATGVLIVLDSLILPGQLPRMVIANDFFVTIVFTGALRSTWRVWNERIAPLGKNRVDQRALLVGHSFEAARVAHMINGQLTLKTRIFALIAPHPTTKRVQFSDLRVVGDLTNLVARMRDYRANLLFVIAGSVPAIQLRNLLDLGAKNNFKIKILPTLTQQLSGSDEMPIREVSCDDLLRRQPKQLNLVAINRFVSDKTVLITGAGGSIGSELCRQVMAFNPKKIILLGRGENRIFHIERELLAKNTATVFLPKIANITDLARMRQIFESDVPDIVFHAAAHKHVPLVEKNVGESIINNVLGTKNVADLADEFGVKRFILISTDKAVNPTSIMGCTKQMAERYCQTLGSKSNTRFISTRFGNVLGSAGSVVPIFQKQIQAGGPITITDRRMTRYFMTIPEATQLVIQAASMGNGGEVFVLEMGKPVRILDLARDLIRLAGHPPNSIDIVETGMRPGEKLFEELYYENEKSLPTEHDQILSSYSRIFSFEEVESQVLQLIEAAYEPPQTVRELMRQFVPEFITQESASKLTRVPSL